MRSLYQVLSGDGAPSDHRGERRTMKQPLIWLGVLAFGLLIIAATFTPLLNPPQCPDYADRMPDGSHCIIGVNFDLGLYWLAGGFIAFVGAVGSVVSFAAYRSERG
ncbi:MAG: hypothetical protein M3256_10660 [Actinomycetota bacterium]|nr:hypothetical protein [Actinomycetota bacterium]